MMGPGIKLAVVLVLAKLPMLLWIIPEAHKDWKNRKKTDQKPKQRGAD